MEVEDVTQSLLREATSGESSAPGSVPTTDASADSGDPATLSELAHPAKDKIVWECKRSNSAGKSATTETSVSFGLTNQQWFNKNAPPRSVQGLEASSLTNSWESILNEIRTSSPNKLSYHQELFNQRFNRARHLCYQLLDNPRGSVAHLETLNRLNELTLACVSYSDFFRSNMETVPHSNNNKSLLDKHDQTVHEIQKLKAIILNVCDNTGGQDASGLPTPQQTITFVMNVQAGMVVRYERANNPKKSSPTNTGTPVGGKKGSKGTNNGGQSRGSTSNFEPVQSTSRQEPNRPAGNQKGKQGKTTPSTGRGNGKQTSKRNRSRSNSRGNPGNKKQKEDRVSEIVRAVFQEMEKQDRSRDRSKKGSNGRDRTPARSRSKATRQQSTSQPRSAPSVNRTAPKDVVLTHKIFIVGSSDLASHIALCLMPPGLQQSLMTTRSKNSRESWQRSPGS